MVENEQTRLPRIMLSLCYKHCQPQAFKNRESAPHAQKKGKKSQNCLEISCLLSHLILGSLYLPSSLEDCIGSNFSQQDGRLEILCLNASQNSHVFT